MRMIIDERYIGKKNYKGNLYHKTISQSEPTELDWQVVDEAPNQPCTYDRIRSVHSNGSMLLYE
jgi:hypothetical protein